MISGNETLSSNDGQDRSPALLFKAGKYLLQRTLTILITIVVGVFITVVIANRGGMLDSAVRVKIDRKIFVLRVENSDFEEDFDEERQKLEAAEGLTSSFWPKHLRYTLRALMLDWGDVLDRRKFNAWVPARAGLANIVDSRDIVLARLPNTLLLSGTAFLLLALLGIPMALYLSRHEEGRLDRIIGMLTPLSSVPSWVIGILLVFLFAVQFRIFPIGKMYDSIPPQTLWETIKVVSHHMFLPVLAVVLSLIFQLVYSWRTYLLIYSNEDYLILARAKGLKKNAIDFHYILRPAFPYLITSLAVTLVSFWQMTTALEFFFQWPGIGKAFVDALPNFNSEVMYPGEMSIILAIVVLFAYLLGITVFSLDLMYLLFDPRVRVGSQDGSVLLYQKSINKGWRANLKGLFIRPENQTVRLYEPVQNQRPVKHIADILHDLLSGLIKSPPVIISGIKNIVKSISLFPSGLIGLILVCLLVLVSILVLIFIPFDPVAKEWAGSGFSKTPSVAKLALPKWVNWFRRDDLPVTTVLSSSTGSFAAQTIVDESGASHARMDFLFDYPYSEFPGEIALYLNASYAEKLPFVALTWITPDGREINLKGGAVTRDFTYPFAENVPVSRAIRRNEHLKNWFVTSGSHKTPSYYLLFADPDADEPRVVQGKYTLRVDSMFFEKDNNLDAKLVIFGLVEGWAGTDYLRRDLSIPLLWGLPLALFIGVLGSVTTSLIALILAAASAWLGGWVDYLLQRLTEVNMILPVMAVSVLLFSYYNLSIWLIIGIIILSTVLGNSIKGFRAAFMQEKALGYVEAAKTYGASDGRIITHYLARRIVPTLIPQMVILIPNFIFLEATLAIFNISDPRYPTWGRMLYSALRYGALYGSRFWVLEPLALMLITGLAFVLISFALNRTLIPHLRND